MSLRLFFSASRKRFLLSPFYQVKRSSQLISCRELAALLLALLCTPWLGWVQVVGLWGRPIGPVLGGYFYWRFYRQERRPEMQACQRAFFSTLLLPMIGCAGSQGWHGSSFQEAKLRAAWWPLFVDHGLNPFSTPSLPPTQASSCVSIMILLTG